MPKSRKYLFITIAVLDVLLAFHKDYSHMDTWDAWDYAWVVGVLVFFACLWAEYRMWKKRK